jgi:DnaJ-class molecular chaperone
MRQNLGDEEHRADVRAERKQPMLVRERCPFCAGSGLRAIGAGPLATLETCHACVGRGYIVTEATCE